MKWDIKRESLDATGIFWGNIHICFSLISFHSRVHRKSRRELPQLSSRLLYSTPTQKVIKFGFYVATPIIYDPNRKTIRFSLDSPSFLAPLPPVNDIFVEFQFNSSTNFPFNCFSCVPGKYAMLKEENHICCKQKGQGKGYAAQTEAWASCQNKNACSSSKIIVNEK